MNFKEFFYADLRDPSSGKSIPLYLNPNLKDVMDILHSSQGGYSDDQIRGMTVGDEVYIWDFSKAQHMEVARLLAQNLRLKRILPDICFYLEVMNLNPPQIQVSMSPFSGEALKNGGSVGQHIARLLNMKGMASLAPFIKMKEKLSPLFVQIHGPQAKDANI